MSQIRSWMALVAAGTVLSACGSSANVKPGAGAPVSTKSADSTQPASVPTAFKVAPKSASTKETAAVDAALTRMSKIRGLPITRAVPGETLTREAMIARVKAHVAREVPDDAIVREGRVLQLLGLVPETFDYAEETFAMLQEQLAGFYEPEDGHMYLANDLQGDLKDATLFHELVHALQDQSFDLKTGSHYKPGESDLSFARSALAEGDATSAMFEPMFEKLHMHSQDMPDEQVDDLLGNAAANEASQRVVPPVMQSSLLAPYVAGLKFVNALRRRGGWDLVNSAWKNPPVTSEQILHIEKWQSHEPAVDVRTPPAKSLAGFVLKDADSQGEMGLRLLFEQWATSKDDARTLAANWGGDRTALYEKGSDIALAARVVLDERKSGVATPSAASRVATLGVALIAKLGAPAIRQAGVYCFERPHLGPLLLMLDGNGYILTAGPAAVPTAAAGGPITATSAKATAWKSSASCTEALVWAKEVARH